MSKPEQVLEIEPENELRFRGPFNAPVTSYMKLNNPSDKKVLYKIKTTAPRKYCVRPNSGVLEPFKSVRIAISLQHIHFDPSEKNKHKFMVQTVFAPEGEFNLDQFWKEIDPEQLMDSKLKCVFEMPTKTNELQDDENTTKASPKSVTTNIPNNTLDVELQKAAEEVQQLREEESLLRQENLRLLEELTLLRKANEDKVDQPNRYAPPIQHQDMQVFHVALAIILGIIGILMGKYLL